MAPNDSGLPDPGQDSYAGSVEQEMRTDAVQKVRDEHRGDAGWSHDPDHRLDEQAAADEAQRLADEFTAGQHDRLAHGIAMRGEPQLGGTNYLSIPHTTLHGMVNNDIDPSGVDQAGAAWNAIGVALRGIGDRLATASTSTEHAWSGSAAEGARSFNAGVANWSQTTGQGALLSANNMATQSDAAGTVKSTVPPPMHYSLWDEVTDLLSAPDPVSGANIVRSKLQQQQELHRQAADAVAAYDQSLSRSSSTMPAFATPPAFDPNFHDRTVTPSTGSTPPPHHLVPVGGPTQPGGRNSLPPAGNPTPPGPKRDPSPGSRAPIPSSPKVGQPGSPDTNLSRTGSSSPDARPGGAGTSGDGLGGLTAGGGRAAGDPEFAALGGAPIGAWNSGPGTGDGPRGGAAGGLGGPRNSFDGRGAGAGALAAEQAMLGRNTAGTPGGRGAAGLGGIPLGAGGSTRRGEDEEHERPSYLEGGDPNALFGTDEPTVPPVIE